MAEQPFFLPSLIILIASIPLVTGFVPRNRYYGVRTGKTLADDHVWCAANRFGGWVLILSSLIYLAFACLMPQHNSAKDSFLDWAVHLAVFVLPLLTGVFAIQLYVRRL